MYPVTGRAENKDGDLFVALLFIVLCTQGWNNLENKLHLETPPSYQALKGHIQNTSYNKCMLVKLS